MVRWSFYDGCLRYIDHVICDKSYGVNKQYQIFFNNICLFYFSHMYEFCLHLYLFVHICHLFMNFSAATR